MYCVARAWKKDQDVYIVHLLLYLSCMFSLSLSLSLSLYTDTLYTHNTHTQHTHTHTHTHTHSEGLLEVCFNGYWGSVCQNGCTLSATFSASMTPNVSVLITYSI